MAKSAEKRGKDETKAAEKTVKATAKPAGGARGGITAPVTPSADLAEIVGKKDLPRSEVVKKMWEYIKKNDLQDAKDRRQIVSQRTQASLLIAAGDRGRRAA